MTKERRKEIEERIDWLETRLFEINMIDRWTDRTREYHWKYTRELIELKKELEK